MVATMRRQTASKPVMIPLKSIAWEMTYYPRLSHDWMTAHQYAAAMSLNGADSFPPVVVVRHGNCYLGLDGYHRCDAAKRNKYESIHCIVLDIPESEWFAKAVELNAKHGRSLTMPERVAIVERLKESGFAMERISSLVGMTAAAMAKMAERYGPSGEPETVESNGKHSPIESAPASSQVMRTLAEMESLLRNPKPWIDAAGARDAVKRIAKLIEPYAR